jgi:[ribosomal protein S18]-alanine N-acetyltransferase
MSIDAEKIEIRPLEPEDFDAILGIAEILEEAPRWTREQYDEVIRADSARPRITLVASISTSRKLIGFVIAGMVAPDAELESIAVAAQAQRRGVGSRLLGALYGELRQLGIEELHLEVRESNQAAIRFYQAQNFKQIGVRPRYYVDPAEDAILMNLDLR